MEKPKFFRNYQIWGLRVSDLITECIGTWTFIFIYTASMFAWIILHIKGILNIDTRDFIKWNLLLSYFAGTQASIVLMSTTRQSKVDRLKLDHHISIDQETLTKVEALCGHIEELDNLVEEMIREDEDHESNNH